MEPLSSLNSTQLSPEVWNANLLYQRPELFFPLDQEPEFGSPIPTIPNIVNQNFVSSQGISSITQTKLTTPRSSKEILPRNQKVPLESADKGKNRNILFNCK